MVDEFLAAGARGTEAQLRSAADRDSRCTLRKLTPRDS